MQSGDITGYFDVAQITLYGFWIFFAGLIYYLRQEDKREGYPLSNDRSGEVVVEGFPPIPSPKNFILRQGGTYQAPPGNPDVQLLNAGPAERFPGAPLVPHGNPMIDGVGPAAHTERGDEPEPTAEGEPRIVPLRVRPSFYIEPRDPDPRGREVIAADGKLAGIVQEVWIDLSEPQIRYLEVEVANVGRRVLLPFNLCRVSRYRPRIKVVSVLASQFADAPGTRDPDHVTLREEDRIMAYFGSGHLYATPDRQEPLI